MAEHIYLLRAHRAVPDGRLRGCPYCQSITPQQGRSHGTQQGNSRFPGASHAAGRFIFAVVIAHRILFPVRMRIHWGMGRFCFSFFARVFFVRKVLLAGLRSGPRRM